MADGFLFLFSMSMKLDCMCSLPFPLCNKTTSILYIRFWSVRGITGTTYLECIQPWISSQLLRRLLFAWCLFFSALLPITLCVSSWKDAQCGDQMAPSPLCKHPLASKLDSSEVRSYQSLAMINEWLKVFCKWLLGRSINMVTTSCKLLF